MIYKAQALTRIAKPQSHSIIISRKSSAPNNSPKQASASYSTSSFARHSRHRASRRFGVGGGDEPGEQAPVAMACAGAGAGAGAGHVRAGADGVRALRPRRRRVRLPRVRAGAAVAEPQRRLAGWRRVRRRRGPAGAGPRRVAAPRGAAARRAAGRGQEPEHGRLAVHGADRRGRAVRVRGRRRRRPRRAVPEEPELRW